MAGLQIATSGKHWKIVPTKEKRELIENIGHNFIDLPPINEEATEIQELELTFYSGGKLIFVCDGSWMYTDEGYYFLLKEGTLHRLDGNSEVIHAVNDEWGVVINSDTACDYLIFFCAFLLSETGAFPIISGAATETAFSSPILLKEEDGAFFIEALSSHNGGLFRAKYEVLSGGRVTMLEDVMIAALEWPYNFNPHFRLPPEDEVIH